MASLTLHLLHLLLMVSVASAWSGPMYSNYRHYGGSVTFTPKAKNSDGTFEVELRNRQTSFYCYQNGYTCYYGNCGSQTQTTKALIARNSYGLNWCQYEVVTKRKLKNNQRFAIRYPTSFNSRYGQGYWISNVRSAFAAWRMMAHIDLGTRSDTGESNRSPITTMMPVLRVTRNCPRSFNLTMFDPDGDRVRCRVPTSSSTYECSLCGLVGGFSLDQNSCSLHYTYKNKHGLHPIELVVEDFPNKPITLSYSDGFYTKKNPLSSKRRKRQMGSIRGPPANLKRYRSSIAPLSKLPLQFTVKVDSYDAPSCLDGDYFPIFLAPTPSNGVNLPAFVNQTLEIKVVSTAQNSTIHDLIISGPKGISKKKISTEEYVIKWTPTDNELNDHFPICFVSEARHKVSTGKVYQSEMRCVIADVGHYETAVTCSETTMTVEVEKTYLIRRNEDNLHLNDPSCNLTTRSNKTHLVAVMSLNTCGTVTEEDAENIIFKNEITSADPSDIISRQHDVEIAFSCVYPKRTNMTLGYSHKNPYGFTEKGFGAFTFQFEFFDSERFRRKRDASTYPVKVYLKRKIFMQIEATASIPNTELFVESCKATPYDNRNSRINYTIIENGCVRDKTVQIYPSSRTQFRFGMEAFEFIGAHDEVHITCSVMLCETGIPGTRCSQGCISSVSGNHRSKRAAVAQSSSHSISQGPLYLVKTPDSKASGLNLNLGMNLMFIVGCLMFCAVVVYRTRKSKVASAWGLPYYRYYGGSVTFTPKAQNSDGTFEVELRNKQTSFYCYQNGYTCYYGNCGSQTQTTNALIARNSYGLNWCQYEVVTKRKLNSNQPFAIRYPTYHHSYYGQGYWISNVRSHRTVWRMMAHIDLGTRSDTGESNRSPITNMMPVLRVNRNCPRSFNLTVFDPDGDRVRCRVPRSSSTYECSLCGLVGGFSLDENSCSLQYTFSHSTGYHPIELVVEDFPKKHITLSYSDGRYTSKHPLSSRRRKRQVQPNTTTPSNATSFVTSTAAPTTATAASTTTRASPSTTAFITTTAASTTTTASSTTTTSAQATSTDPSTTTTASSTTTSAAPITTTAAPITTTAAPTTTSAQATTTDPSTTTTASSTTTSSAPITTTYVPITTTAAPVTTTYVPITTTYVPITTTAVTTTLTTTAAPVTTTAASTTTTAAPTTTTDPSTTTTSAPITTTAAQTTTTVSSTTTTSAQTTTAASTTTTAAPTTTTAAPTTTSRPYQSSIAPLSKLPLQFSVYVDSYYAPSCLDGDYFPIFLAPTPANGVNLPAFVNQTLEIRVVSTAQYSTIYDLIISGPKGIYKQKISTEEYVIKWTPTDNELNDHFPICFVSEARNRVYSYHVYQSELRCVIADVGHHEAAVTCNETTMTVEVEKTYLIRQNEDNLHLNDPSCNLTTRSNSTHLVAVMSLNTCGTTTEEDEDNIIFKNEITSADPSEIISRQHDVEIAFSCVYPKRSNMTLGFSHKNPYAFTEKGFGAFTFQFEFFDSQRFMRQKNGSTYPVEVYLKQMIFMQMKATTSIPNTELFVESCKATPYDNPNYPISYTIIKNGCVRDKTVQIYPSSRLQFRFGMEAFEFIGAHEEVYITCSVMLCETGIPGTRCSQGCISSVSGNHRSKREAAAQSSSHSISQGPLHLAKTSDSKASGSNLNLGMNIMFIVGCLLACAVVVYRTRRSKGEYQPLPTSETD
ncbi:hypothetical protein L3Q82_008457%2C partial [Scomber scombrus]|uniref:ZP domain-containing protein n=1 Tax=Scomber scombrus TaxID=13677 RepID=A0AAV1Q673_SCOSC